jgi:hypothetical protein
LSGKVSAGGGSPIVKLLLILEHFSAISLVALSHSRVADNEIRLAPCGVFALATLATSVVANRVNTSLAGVMMAVVAECEASDNIVDASLTGAPTIGVALLGALRCVAERNAISNVASGIITALSIATRAQDNDVYITETGVISLIDVDLELRGNTIEDALNTSIEAIFPLHELTMAHDRVLRSGYRAGGMAPTPAVGILVLGAIGLVTIDSCHVIDTGESPDGAAPSFTGERHGIVVLFAIGTRVHGCTVASQPLVGNAVVNPGDPPVDADARRRHGDLRRRGTPDDAVRRCNRQRRRTVRRHSRRDACRGRDHVRHEPVHQLRRRPEISGRPPRRHARHRDGQPREDQQQGAVALRDVR